MSEGLQTINPEELTAAERLAELNAQIVASQEAGAVIDQDTRQNIDEVLGQVRIVGEGDDEQLVLDGQQLDGAAKESVMRLSEVALELDRADQRAREIEAEVHQDLLATGHQTRVQVAAEAVQPTVDSMQGLTDMGVDVQGTLTRAHLEGERQAQQDILHNTASPDRFSEGTITRTTERATAEQAEIERFADVEDDMRTTYDRELAHLQRTHANDAEAFEAARADLDQRAHAAYMAHAADHTERLADGGQRQRQEWPEGWNQERVENMMPIEFETLQATNPELFDRVVAKYEETESMRDRDAALAGFPLVSGESRTGDSYDATERPSDIPEYIWETAGPTERRELADEVAVDDRNNARMDEAFERLGKVYDLPGESEDQQDEPDEAEPTSDDDEVVEAEVEPEAETDAEASDEDAEVDETEDEDAEEDDDESDDEEDGDDTEEEDDDDDAADDHEDEDHDHQSVAERVGDLKAHVTELIKAVYERAGGRGQRGERQATEEEIQRQAVDLIRTAAYGDEGFYRAALLRLQDLARGKNAMANPEYRILHDALVRTPVLEKAIPEVEFRPVPTLQMVDNLYSMIKGRVVRDDNDRGHVVGYKGRGKTGDLVNDYLRQGIQAASNPNMSDATSPYEYDEANRSMGGNLRELMLDIRNQVGLHSQMMEILNFRMGEVAADNGRSYDVRQQRVEQLTAYDMGLDPNTVSPDDTLFTLQNKGSITQEQLRKALTYNVMANIMNGVRGSSYEMIKSAPGNPVSTRLAVEDYEGQTVVDDRLLHEMFQDTVDAVRFIETIDSRMGLNRLGNVERKEYMDAREKAVQQLFNLKHTQYQLMHQQAPDGIAWGGPQEWNERFEGIPYVERNNGAIWFEPDNRLYFDHTTGHYWRILADNSLEEHDARGRFVS